jgi:hypothetical protein
MLCKLAKLNLSGVQPLTTDVDVQSNNLYPPDPPLSYHIQHHPRQMRRRCDRCYQIASEEVHIKKEQNKILTALGVDVSVENFNPIH